MAVQPSPGIAGTARGDHVRPPGLPPVPSVLGMGTPGRPEDEPDYFAYLNLDQLVASITAGRAEYDLPPFFYHPLGSLEAVHFRQEVFRDLRVAQVRRAVDDFAELMRGTRRLQTRAHPSRYHYQRERWWLDAGATYCRAVEGLTRSLAAADLRSCGLTAVCDALLRHVASDGFRSLVAQTAAVREGLGAVRYCLAIRGGSIRVTRFDDEADYSEAVERVFERFHQGETRPVEVEFSTSPDMNHVEAGSWTWWRSCSRLPSPRWTATARITSVSSTSRWPASTGRCSSTWPTWICWAAWRLPGCRSAIRRSPPPRRSRPRTPTTSRSPTSSSGRAGRSSATTSTSTAPNGSSSSRGPTKAARRRARTFGQLHHLGALGAPVPGRAAALFLPDRVFTHFEKAEELSDLHGKLQDDLVRIRDILDHATADSVVILNEIFTSTTLEDAAFLGRRIMERILGLDLLCVCVTFVDELATLGDTVVSMVSTVDEQDQARRTYKVVRRPAEGLAYALAVAERHGLTYERAKERLSG